MAAQPRLPRGQHKLCGGRQGTHYGITGYGVSRPGIQNDQLKNSDFCKLLRLSVSESNSKNFFGLILMQKSFEFCTPQFKNSTTLTAIFDTYINFSSWKMQMIQNSC